MSHQTSLLFNLGLLVVVITLLVNTYLLIGPARDHGAPGWVLALIGGILAITIGGLGFKTRFAWILAHVLGGAFLLTAWLFLINAARANAIATTVLTVVLYVTLNLPAIRARFAIEHANRIVLGILISILFMYLAFRGTPMGQIWQAMLKVNYLWLIPAVLVYIVGIWVRAMRWQYILKPVKHCPIKSLFPIYIISYMANNILPLRMGDLYRAYIAGRKEGVSKTAALTTVAVERVFDGLTMLLFLVIGSLFFPFSEDIKIVIRYGAYGFVGMLVLCYLALWKRALAEKTFSWFVVKLPERFHAGLQKVFNSVFDGLAVLKGPRDLFMVTVLSIITWLIEASMFDLVLRGFSLNLPFHASLSTLAVVNLGIIIPAGPGYFGPFEYFCSLVLGPRGYGAVAQYGITEEISKAYALVLHVIGQWLPSTLLGLYYMWREHIAFKEVESTTPQPSNLKD